MSTATNRKRRVMTQESLRIGEVASRAGVNIQTLRFYERRGLLREPARRPSGYRAYPADAVRVVRFIKHAQALGFALKEIEELLKLREPASGACADVQRAAEAKISDIDAKVRRLLAIRRALATLVRSCSANSTPRCPLLEAIGEESEKRQ